MSALTQLPVTYEFANADDAARFFSQWNIEVADLDGARVTVYACRVLSSMKRTATVLGGSTVDGLVSL